MLTDDSGRSSFRQLQFHLRYQFIVYIDGYNLYKAIDHPTTLKLGWCNYRTLAHRLVELSFGYQCSATDFDSVQVKYFTALVRQQGKDDTGGHKGEERRQQLWLRVLQREARLDLIEGAHRRNPDGSHREKMTDVKIALAMTEDARTRHPAGMVLVSGDQDFVPAIETVLALKIPVSVFNPNDHLNFQLDAKITSRDLFEITHLTQDIMAACPLGHEREWIDYLERKVDSCRGRKFEADYQAMLDDEKRRARNQQRVASR
jgi:uncharacterized LabA/DUF88 family protein